MIVSTSSCVAASAAEESSARPKAVPNLKRSFLIAVAPRLQRLTMTQPLAYFRFVIRSGPASPAILVCAAEKHDDDRGNHAAFVACSQGGNSRTMIESSTNGAAITPAATSSPSRPRKVGVYVSNPLPVLEIS